MTKQPDSETEPPKGEADTSTLAERFRTQLFQAKKELESVQDRLVELEQEKADLEQSALKLATRIEILEPISYELDEEADKLGREKLDRQHLEWSNLAQQAGIQECCYRVLLDSDGPLDAASIRYELEEEAHIDMSRYANPLAVIHTSLKRIPDRVRSFRQKQKAYDSSAKVWVRYYEAIKPGAETPSKK